MEAAAAAYVLEEKNEKDTSFCFLNLYLQYTP